MAGMVGNGGAMMNFSRRWIRSWARCFSFFIFFDIEILGDRLSFFNHSKPNFPDRKAGRRPLVGSQFFRRASDGKISPGA
jgi:hypothetical protein